MEVKTIVTNKVEKFFDMKRKVKNNMSQLLNIISRLQQLKEFNHDGDVPQRYFEINGEKKCSVKYFHKSDTYELEIFENENKKETFQFDNIDIIAIEIFEIIQL